MLLFTDLPVEIVSSVLGYVDPDDLAAVERVCHRLHDCVACNRPVHRAVYCNYFDPPPKELSLDWEREIRDYLRLKSICLSTSPDKISQLPFVYETTKRILRHAQPVHIDTDPDTLVQHRTFRNARILSRLLSPYPKKDSFVCQSWLFERARYLGPSSDEEDEGPSYSHGHGHGRGSRTTNKNKTKAHGKVRRPPFCLPGPASADPETHARRQRSAELQCLLGMPSLVCPPESSAGDEGPGEPEPRGPMEFVYENAEEYEDDVDDDDDDEDEDDDDDDDDEDYVDYDYENLDGVDDYEAMQQDGHESVVGGGEEDEDGEEDDEGEEIVDDGEIDDDIDDDDDDDDDDLHHHHHHHHRHHHHESSRWRRPPHGSSHLRDMYPLAAAKVYDMRENTLRTRWGPFQADGSGRVDWERLEAILIVLRFNITVKGLLKFPALREYWDTPFAGSWPSSYLPMLRGGGGAGAAGAAGAAEAAEAADGAGAAGEDTAEGELSEEAIRELDQKDPYGITGTWMRIVCFLDYTEFFAFNFTEIYSNDMPMDPLDHDEELRMITMRIHATRIEPPGPDDHPDYPVVHFKGRSYAMDDIWDDNANSAVQGTVRTNKEGHVHWTTFSLFNDEQRWRSEGIQVGGPKSGRGVVGTWFDSEYNAAGPCGPTAFWKMHERGAERALSRGNAFSYLLANTVDNSIRIVVNINHPFGQTIEVADMMLSDPLGFLEDPDAYDGAYEHPMFPDDGSFSSID